MTIESIFDLQPGTGGLHNLLDLHEAFLDEQGRFSLKLNVTDRLTNPKEIVHGGTLFALCDCAIGTYMAFHKKWAVTLESTIHFYRPALPGDILTATVNERKLGYSVSTFLIEVYDDAAKHIVDATFTMYYTK